ncbi:MAG: helix-turn-helix domain-containing protein [Oligoflexales bacterium]
MSNVEKDYYSTLEVDINATFDDIQKSYLKLKNTYVSSNQALYSLMSPESIQSIVEQIDQAYEVLSNPASRSKYHETLSLDEENTLEPQEICEQHNTLDEKSLSGPHDIIDWLPDPMNDTMNLTTLNSEDLKENSNHGVHSENFSTSISFPRELLAVSEQAQEKSSDIQRILSGEDLADGRTYQMIREQLLISKQEIFEKTQISNYYIKCLEENDFDLLPQTVYLKGFLKGYLSYIGIPDIQTTVHAYLSRFQIWWDNKNALGS